MKQKRIVAVLFVLMFSVLVLPAQNDSKEKVECPTVDKSAWWLRVCKRQTESAAAEFRVGMNAGDFATVPWSKQTGFCADVDVPEQYRAGDKLWIYGRAYDLRRVVLCVVHGTKARGVLDYYRESPEETFDKTAEVTCDCLE